MNNQEKFNQLIEQSTVFINGQHVSAGDAKISVFDRGFLYGDSVYEVCYTEDSQVVFFDEHIKRLKKSADLLNIEFFTPIEEIVEQVEKTIQKSGLKNAYIRIVLTRGESIISLDPATSFKNNIVTIAKPVPVYPKHFYTEGVKLHLTSVIRNDIKSVDPNAKSGNYLNNVMALDEAKKNGADDALMLNSKGEISEGSTFNFWLVINGEVFTPPSSSGLLEGITRKMILSFGDSLGFNISEKTLSKDDLPLAQEAFITSSTRKIIPVQSINEKKFGDSIEDWSLTKKLMIEFEKLRQGRLRER